MNWQELYAHGFSVEKETPSRVVVRGFALIDEPGVILDIGAGKGRNSAYAAQRKHTVHAIDLVDTQITRRYPDLPIQYLPQSIDTFHFPRSFYTGVILTRVLHYLSPHVAEKVLEESSLSMKSGGIFMLNYNFRGGVLGNDCTPHFIHDPLEVQTLLECNHLDIVETQQVAGISPTAFGNHPLLGLEVIARKR